MKNRFYKAINPIKRKMAAEKTIIFALYGMATGFLAAAVVEIISKFIFLRYGYIIEISFVLAGAAAGAVAAFALRPKFREAAEAGDSLGFNERFITAVDIIENKSSFDEAMSEMALKNAVENAESAKLAKMYKLRLPKKAISSLGIFLALFTLVAFIPATNLNEEITKNRKNLDKAIAEEIKKIEEARKDISSELNESQAKEIDELLAGLTKELKKAKTPNEATKKIKKTQEELQKLANSSMSKDLTALADKLKHVSETKDIAEKLTQSETASEAVDELVEKLEQLMKDLSEEDLKKLAEELENAADEMTDEELAEALSALAENIGTSEAADSLESLQSALGNAANQNSGFRNAAKNINGKLQKSTKAINKATGQSSETETSESESSGDNSGDTQGNEESQNQGQGNGTGQGQGQGQGSGQGNGQGQGQGSGQGNGQGQGNGTGRGQGHMEPEYIYSREAQGMSDYEAMIEGSETDDGYTNQIEQKRIGQAGESIPYTDVLGSYRDEALSALEVNEIPAGMKDLVKDYFTSLQ